MAFTDSITTITDENVNGGTAINLQATKLDVKIEVFSNVEAVVFDDLTDTFANRLSPASYGGFNNPQFTLNGKLYIGEATSNTITYAFLKSLAASSAEKTLVDSLLGSISVVIKSVTVNREYTKNGLCSYTLQMVRV